MTENTYYKDCPNCKNSLTGTIRGVYRYTNQTISITIKKCSACKLQVGVKQFEKLKPINRIQSVTNIV